MRLSYLFLPLLLLIGWLNGSLLSANDLPRQNTYFKKTGVVYQGEKVAGYWHLSVTSGGMRSKQQYHLQLTDADLSPIGVIEYKMEVMPYFSSITTNGETVTIIRPNSSGLSIVEFYNAQLELVRKVDVYSAQKLGINGQKVASKNVYPVPGGFVYLTPYRNKKTPRQVVFLPADEATTGWETTIGSVHAHSEILRVQPDYIMVAVERKTGKGKNHKLVKDLHVYELNKGKRVLRVPDYNAGGSTIWKSISFDGALLQAVAIAEQRDRMFKRYFNRHGAVEQLTYDLEGKEVSRQAFDWTSELDNLEQTDYEHQIDAQTPYYVKTHRLADKSYVLDYVFFHPEERYVKRAGFHLRVHLGTDFQPKATHWTPPSRNYSDEVANLGYSYNENIHDHYLVNASEEEIVKYRIVVENRGYESPPLHHRLELFTFFDGEFFDQRIEFPEPLLGTSVFSAKPGFVLLEFYDDEAQAMQRKLIKLDI